MSILQQTISNDLSYVADGSFKTNSPTATQMLFWIMEISIAIDLQC